MSLCLCTHGPSHILGWGIEGKRRSDFLKFADMVHVVMKFDTLGCSTFWKGCSANHFGAKLRAYRLSDVNKQRKEN